jgi:hypothetical protein
MERIVAALLLFAPLQDGKKKDAPESGPLGLPLLSAVKGKCQPSAEQAPKLDALYAEAAKNEADIRRRAKESESDRKTTEKFLADGRLDMVLKIKELFDAAQDKAFDELASAAPAKKKK